MRPHGLLLCSALAAACASSPPVRPIAVPLPNPPRPLNELEEQLRAADAPSRVAAAWALAGAGTVDSEVVRALMAALDDPSDPVREAATWALWHIKNPALQSGQLMDTPPKPLVHTKPRYPQDAFAKKVEGTVVVTLLISAIGKVAHAEIRQSLPGLDEAALACVRDWLFEPAKRGGKPVACVAEAPVTFRIY